MPKREERGEMLLVVVAIPHKQSFAVINFAVFARIVDKRRRIFQPHGEGSGELARGSHIPKQDTGQGIARLLATIPALHNGGHSVRPRHLHGRTDV